jgi:hypothetical protein
MTSIYEVIAETVIRGVPIQLVKDSNSVHFLRFCPADEEEQSLSAPLHSDTAVLAEARELFPDHLPFAGLPVDAT